MQISRPLSLLDRFLMSPLSLVLAVVLAFIVGAASLPLTDVDEGAFSEATREMMARGNLVSPTMNGNPRHDKPILIYWAQAASVSVLGVSEIGFRLPSIVFAVLWMLALYRFCLRHGDRRTAQVAALVMALTLMVGIVAKAAIADALLNLFIALAMFGIYDFFVARRDGRDWPAQRRMLWGIYGALGCGFLAKGPVAVFFPLLISALFFVSAGRWRDWLKAVFYWPGWLIFLAIIVPWHVAVFLDQGDAFFRGFYLKHNVDRYADTFEGHGGKWYYYLVVTPFILMPFTGWLAAIAGKVVGLASRQPLFAAHGQGLFERYLLLWFAIVFLFFSFSGTQLPHYLLYGCTPIFILLARHRLESERRWLAWGPVLLFATLLAVLPEVLPMLAKSVKKPYEQVQLAEMVVGFADQARWLLPLAALAILGLALWRRLPVWQGLVLAGLVQVIAFSGVIAPRVIAVTQGPVREAAQFVQQRDENVVAYRIIRPSFSVYRQAITPTRVPAEGELVFTRTDRLNQVQAKLPPTLQAKPVFQRSFATVAKVERVAP